MKFSLTNEFKDKLRAEIQNSNVKFIKRAFIDISYVDITELLYEFVLHKSAAFRKHTKHSPPETNNILYNLISGER